MQISFVEKGSLVLFTKFFIPYFTHITEVKYMQIDDILSSFGGLYTSLAGIIISFCSFFILKSWESSLMKSCYGVDTISED